MWTDKIACTREMTKHSQACLGVFVFSKQKRNYIDLAEDISGWKEMAVQEYQ
jgi:hypothetical protein